MDAQLFSHWLRRLCRKGHHPRTSPPTTLLLECGTTGNADSTGGLRQPDPVSGERCGLCRRGRFRRQRHSGRADLVHRFELYPLTLYLSNTNGTLQPPRIIPGIQNTQGIAVGDFNGDHKLDFAVVTDTGSTSSVTVELGNGDGTFQVPVSYPISTGTARLVVAGNFTSDNHLDLAVVSPTAPSVSCWGTVTAPSSRPSISPAVPSAKGVIT